MEYNISKEISKSINKKIEELLKRELGFSPYIIGTKVFKPVVVDFFKNHKIVSEINENNSMTIKLEKIERQKMTEEELKSKLSELGLKGLIWCFNGEFRHNVYADVETMKFVAYEIDGKWLVSNVVNDYGFDYERAVKIMAVFDYWNKQVFEQEQ